MIGTKARMAILIMLLGPVVAGAIRLTEVEVGLEDQTTHVEMISDEAWNYSLKEMRDKIEVAVHPLSEQSEQRLLTYSDKFIKSVDINANGPDGKYIVGFHLKKPTISVFHYLSDQPARLILDFYVDEKKVAAEKKRRLAQQKGKTSSEVIGVQQLSQLRSRNLTDKEKASLSRIVASENARSRLSQDFIARQLDPNSPDYDFGALPTLIRPEEPAKESRKGIFDGGDPQFQRFSFDEKDIDPAAIIRSRRNVYMPFPMLENDLKYLEMLEANLPIYKIMPKKSEENRMARLLLKLFNNNRPALFMHTYKMFMEKYPESQYREIILFMDADLAYRKYMETRARFDFEDAMERYTMAMREYPNSTLKERVLILKGFARLKMKNSLGTLSLFGDYLRNYPDSSRRAEVLLAQASAYIRLRRYKEAMKIYTDLAQDKEAGHHAREAEYRMGDIYFHKKEYRKAVTQYQIAFNTYPNAWAHFPNAFYNSGEALFWMGEYKKSIDFFRDFLRRFPENSHAGYAMTRIGELMEIVGADKQRVVGAFLETHFRYGDTPGADVAQIRLMSHRMKDMKEKELGKTLKKMYGMGKESYLYGMNQFVTIMVADGFTARKNYDQAIAILDNFYRKNPTHANQALIGSRVEHNVYLKLKDSVESSQFLAALKIHDEMKDNWLKGHERIDIPFAVGRAYELAGAYERAAEFYQDSLKRHKKALKDPHEYKIKAVFEEIPTIDSQKLRIAVSRFRDGKVGLAEMSLKQTSAEKLKDDEQVERILLSSEIAEKMGRSREAAKLLSEFIEMWDKEEKSLMPSYLRLGQLKLKAKKMQESVSDFEKVVQLGNDNPGSDKRTHARAMEELGGVLVEMGDEDKALATWQSLIEKYEGQLPLAQVRYKAGQVLFKKGQIQDAIEYWDKLKEEPNSFWFDLASEQLKNSRWRNDYKRYIDRIPAMAKGEGSEQ